MSPPLPISGAKVPHSLRWPTFLVALLWIALLFISCPILAQEASPPAASQPVAPADPVGLADQVVRDVLSPFQRAIETRDYRLLLSTFDAAATPDFPQIREQFDAFFRLHDNIRFRYQLLQVSSDKDLGFAIADLDMDAQPRDTLPTEQRHSGQVRFQMKRTDKGWRLTGLKPISFFTQ